MKGIISVLFCMFLIVALNCVKAEQNSQLESHKSNLDDSDEFRKQLLSSLYGNSESNLSDEDESEESQPDKRMTYRYGKRMTYRYGKRSAMPYRFGKRSDGLSAQDIIEYLRLHDNNDDIKKRMTYRYGRSLDKRSTN